MTRYDRNREVQWLEWEDSSRPLKLHVREPGGLPSGLDVVEVSRGEDLSITVAGSTAKDVVSEPPATRPGELVPEPPPTVGVTAYESNVTLEGVWVEDEHWSSATGTSIRASARLVRETSRSPGVPSWHSEWLANYSTDHKVHPRVTSRKWLMKFTREREGHAPFTEDLAPFREGGEARDHLRLSVTMGSKDWTIRVGETRTEKSTKPFKPGFMEFECEEGAPPSEALKASVLDAVSFALGRRVLSIGGCTFNSNGEPLVREMRRPPFLRYARLFRAPSQAPTPFWTGHTVDEARVQRLVSAVLARMDDLRLRHPLMLAWAASLGFIQESVVGFAAAIEALRDAHEARAERRKAGIAPASEWDPIKAALLERFDSVTGWGAAAGKPRELSLLRAKLSQLNDRSSRHRFNDFFSEIGLPIGEVELDALKRRNLPAHGYELGDEQIGPLVLTTEALRSLFNRVVLKLTGGADEYIDYSTYGFPVRGLDEPLGGPQGDGRPVAFV